MLKCRSRSWPGAQPGAEVRAVPTLPSCLAEGDTARTFFRGSLGDSLLPVVPDALSAGCSPGFPRSPGFQGQAGGGCGSSRTASTWLWPLGRGTPLIMPTCPVGGSTTSAFSTRTAQRGLSRDGGGQGAHSRGLEVGVAGWPRVKVPQLHQCLIKTLGKSQVSGPRVPHCEIGTLMTRTSPAGREDEGDAIRRVLWVLSKRQFIISLPRCRLSHAAWGSSRLPMRPQCDVKPSLNLSVLIPPSQIGDRDRRVTREHVPGTWTARPGSACVAPLEDGPQAAPRLLVFLLFSERPPKL